MADTILVTGNWGEMTCDLATGEVLNYAPGIDFDEADPDPNQGYLKIARIDIAEFNSFLASHGLPAQTGTEDILNLGYWTIDGVYEPATDYRDIWINDAIADERGAALIVNSGAAHLFEKQQ